MSSKNEGGELHERFREQGKGVCVGWRALCGDGGCRCGGAEVTPLSSVELSPPCVRIMGGNRDGESEAVSMRGDDAVRHEASAHECVIAVHESAALVVAECKRRYPGISGVAQSVGRRWGVRGVRERDRHGGTCGASATGMSQRI